MTLLKKPSLEELKAESQQDEHQLHRTLTTSDLIMVGIGAVIGAGLFSITGIAAAENAGPAIVIAFMLGAIGCGFAGMCYCELAGLIPSSGSVYTYTYASMGELPAWIIGWTLILEYAIGAGVVAISWSAYLVSLLHDFGLGLPQEIISSPWQITNVSKTIEGPVFFNLPAVFIVVLLSLILTRGIRQSAIVNMIAVFIKISVITVFIGVGIFYVNPQNYVPFIPENTGTFGEYGWSGILRASGVLFFAYIGFDAISTTVLETKDPQKSIPRGILGSLVICTLIYMAFSLVLTGLVNYKDLDVAAPIAVAIAKTPFKWLQGFVSIAVLSGLTSVILVMLLGQSRIFYVMAKDGLLPPIFAKLHPIYKTPWLSNLILMVFVSVIAAFVPISLISHMTSIGTLLAFIMVCIGVIILRYRRPEHPRSFKVPLFPLIPILGILTCLLMMIFLDIDTWIRLSLWLLVGIGIYLLYGHRHSRRASKNT